MKEEEIKDTLAHCKTVAVVGISPKAGPSQLQGSLLSPIQGISHHPCPP